jgi:hypothetical protein
MSSSLPKTERRSTRCAATLEFGAGVSTAATLGDQDIGFTGGGTLHLLAPTSFYGEISDFGSGDTVELKGSWAFSGLSQTSGVTTLTLASGSTTHGFEFAGGYTQSDFTITPGTTTKITFACRPPSRVRSGRVRPTGEGTLSRAATFGASPNAAPSSSPRACDPGVGMSICDGSQA